MTLAKEIQADYVCLDGLTARRKARRMGLLVIGTLGVLNLTCQLGHLPAQCYKRYLIDLTEKHGMHLSPQLLNPLMKTK